MSAHTDLARERRRVAAYKGVITKLRNEHKGQMLAIARMARDAAEFNERERRQARGVILDLLQGARKNPGHFGADLLNFAAALVRRMNT